MAMPPDPPHIFHITAIPNLPRIAQSGALLSKTRLQQLGRAHDNIAYENIQDRRSRTEVPVGRGGMLHDYVPFHFAPRQPMLMAINNGRVQGCNFRQEEIVHLALRADMIAAAGIPYSFSSHHAVIALAEFYDNLDDLDKIDWDMFFDPPLEGKHSRYFHDPEHLPKYATRRESRQAEFLAHGEVPITQVRGIGVCNEQKREEVERILAQCGWETQVRVKRHWYF